MMEIKTGDVHIVKIVMAKQKFRDKRGTIYPGEKCAGKFRQLSEYSPPPGSRLILSVHTEGRVGAGTQSPPPPPDETLDNF
jgi:hypothetical protein